MDAVSELVRLDVPWDMLFANDLIVAEDSLHKMLARYVGWQKALESKGLNVDASKTETMVR